jgi:hypothetical protein
VISQQLSKVWSNLQLAEGLPQQQTLIAKGVKIQTGLTQSTVTLTGNDVFSPLKVRQITDTFDIWRKALELGDLARVSTRIMYSKDFDLLKDANDKLRSFGLVRWPDTKVFDQPMESDQNAYHLQLRFQDDKSFSFLTVETEQLKYEVELDPEFVDETEIKESKNRVVIDFDRGILTPTRAEKFRMDEWLKGFQHILRRDLDKVIKAQA